jgi:hypothetical protein
MTDESQLVYLRRRLLEERDLAAAAACEKSREVHAKMSRLYEARLTLTHVDQANSAVIKDPATRTVLKLGSTALV